MKKLKNITYLLCMVIIVTCINGCSLTKEKVNPVALRMQMLEFVEEKYDMKFIATYFAKDDDNAHLIVYPKGGNKEKDSFKVGWKRDKKSNEEKFFDSLSAIKMSDKYKEKLEELLNPYFESYSVEVRADMCVLPNEFGLNDDFQQVIDKEVEYIPHVDIRVTHSSDTVDDFNNKIDDFFENVSESHISGHILIVYLKNKEINSEIMANDEEYYSRRYVTIEN